MFVENDRFKKGWLLTYEQKRKIHCNLQSFSELLYNDDEEDNSSNDDDGDDDIDNNSVIYPRQYL